MTESEWYFSDAAVRMMWNGTVVKKHPCDMWVFQELIHETKPDVIVETGTWLGGSACYYADLGVEVHSVDVAPAKTPTPHPLVTYHRGFSTSPNILYHIGEAVRDKRCMVFLDSDHHKANVLAELDAYALLVSSGCYLIVEDTNLGRTIHDTREEFAGDGPADALDEWLPNHPEFTVDRSCERHGITMHPGGFLLRS